MSTTRFTLRQLDIFAAVMTTGRVRSAAERLNVGQAAVSQALRELAQALDVVLFVHRGRALVPTPQAHRLLALTQAPRAELADLAQKLRGDASHALAGPIAIAASSTIARYLLPAPLARLSATYPALSVTLTSGNSATIETRVAEGEAELGFIEGPSIRNDIATRYWHTDRLEIIGPPEAPGRIAVPDLHAWPWVMRETGSGTRTVFEQSLALTGIAAPRATLTIDDSGAQVRAVAAGAGLACVSRAAARSAARDGDIRFIQLGEHRFERPLWAIRRASDTDTPLIARVLDALTPE